MGTGAIGTVATKSRTIACKLRGLSTMDGLRTVRLRNEGFFVQNNFVSGGLRAHVSYKPLHARSGLTVDCSANATKGRWRCEGGGLSSRACI